MTKKILKLILIYFIIIITLVISLTIVNLIPRKNIENNVRKSLQIFIK